MSNKKSLDAYNVIYGQCYNFRKHFNGIVTAKCDNVPDALHMRRNKEEVEGVAKRVAEPVLFKMGNDIEQLFIPDTETTQQLCNNSLPSEGAWLPAVSKKTKTVIEEEAAKIALLFSGASATQDITYELHVGLGGNVKLAREHLNELGRSGLKNISLELNDGLIVYPE